MSDGRPLGHVLDTLGVMTELGDDDVILSVVSLVLTQRPDDDTPSLCMVADDGCHWVLMLGMLRAGLEILGQSPPEERS